MRKFPGLWKTDLSVPLRQVAQACRTLAYLLELVPQSSAAAVAALPALLQQLRSVSSVEVAEQALAALELLTKRHGNAVLQAVSIEGLMNR